MLLTATAAILDNIANNSLLSHKGEKYPPFTSYWLDFWYMSQKKKYSRFCFGPAIPLAKIMKKGNKSPWEFLSIAILANNVRKIVWNFQGKWIKNGVIGIIHPKMSFLEKRIWKLGNWNLALFSYLY